MTSTETSDVPRIIFLLPASFSEKDTRRFTASVPQADRDAGSAVVAMDSQSPSGFVAGGRNGKTSVPTEPEVDFRDSDYIAVVSAPSVLTRNGFSSLRSAIIEAKPDVIYSDSFDGSNVGIKTIVRRPDFSPERLRCQNYLGELVLYAGKLFRDLGGLRPDFRDAMYFDLALRATVSASLVAHTPAQIYISVPAAGAAAESTNGSQEDFHRVLQQHLDSTGGGTVGQSSVPGIYETHRLVRGEPLISIVIPTRGTASSLVGVNHCYVLDAVSSIMQKSTYRNFEIVIVFDSVAEPGILDQLREIAGDKLRLVEWSRPFNFSEKMNFGVLHAAGEFVLLLNDDIQVLSERWLQSLLALAQLPNAGMVGAMLYYDDDTIQHAGHAYYQGSPTHIGLGLPRGSTGPLDGFLVEREVSGVTAACALMPRSVFMDVGGFTALLPGNFNDVDLCMKVGWKGFATYWTPHAELYHFESKTRDAHVHYYELDVIGRRWGLRLDDPRFWPGHPAAAA